MRFLHDEISPNTYVNLMDQYHPAGKTERYPEIHRPIQEGEYDQAYETMREEGMGRLDARAPGGRRLPV